MLWVALATLEASAQYSPDLSSCPLFTHLIGTDELRDELGVKALAQRRSLLSAIGALKRENEKLDASTK